MAHIQVRLATKWVDGTTTYRFCACDPGGAAAALKLAQNNLPAGAVRVRLSVGVPDANGNYDEATQELSRQISARINQVAEAI